jgi:hypothetical protein
LGEATHVVTFQAQSEAAILTETVLLGLSQPVQVCHIELVKVPGAYVDQPSIEYLHEAALVVSLKTHLNNSDPL